MTVWGFDVFVSDAHRIWLGDLSRVYDLAWATTWEHVAAEHVAPVYDLPTEMPVIEFASRHWSRRWKVADVDNFCADRPLAWIDDKLKPSTFAWGKRREEQTLLLRPKPELGLEEAHVVRLMEFARSLSEAS